MKKKELNEIKTKQDADLVKQLAELRAKSVDLKFDLAAGKVKNISEIHKVKKGISQILTILKERSSKESVTKSN